MTEAEWLAYEDPEAKLIYWRDRCAATNAIDRKYRLITIACAREELERAKSSLGYFNLGERITADLHEFYWHPQYGYEKAILYAECVADSVPGAKPPLERFTAWLVGMSYEGCDLAFAALGYDPDGLVDIPSNRRAEMIRSYHTHPSRYIHEVFGNPFRPVTFSPSWRTDTTVALAAQMYESRDFSAMPILADALQDAGCDCDEVLDHCRGPGPHVRGCWVADRVLGKE